MAHLPEKHVDARLRWLTKLAQGLLRVEAQRNVNGMQTTLTFEDLKTLIAEDRALSANELSFDDAAKVLDTFLRTP